MEFSIKIERKHLSNIVYSSNIQGLNIQVKSLADIAGPVPGGDPDIEVTFTFTDPSEIFKLAWYAAKLPISLTF